MHLIIIQLISMHLISCISGHKFLLIASLSSLLGLKGFKLLIVLRHSRKKINSWKKEENAKYRRGPTGFSTPLQVCGSKRTTLSRTQWSVYGLFEILFFEIHLFNWMKEPEDLGWRPYVKTWIQRLQELTKVKGWKKKPAQRNFRGDRSIEIRIHK